MSSLTAVQRGDLAEEMLPVAARLATIVHGDGGTLEVEQVLSVLDGREKDALIVVLAGLADPDRPLAALLGWLDFDEAGAPVEPAHDDRSTLRDLVERQDDDADAAALVDEVAVRRYLAGSQIKLSKPDRIAAIHRGLSQGMEWHDLDRLSGLAKGSTYTFLLRERKAAVLRGETLEWRTSLPQPLTEAQVIDIRERIADGEDAFKVAASHDISKSHTYRIARGEHYPHYGGPIREPNTGPATATQTIWAGRSGSAAKGLSPADQDQVRARAQDGASVDQLAAEFKVNTTSIREYAAS